ncbi:hypothetical protein M885DRAFT_540268 [Pelagophyceae sp. CCMP2097]|nr:hypothetical protein M885DRAFT_540268 [Pelagophyceae sp. CCMP2097]
MTCLESRRGALAAPLRFTVTGGLEVVGDRGGRGGRIAAILAKVFEGLHLLDSREAVVHLRNPLERLGDARARDGEEALRRLPHDAPATEGGVGDIARRGARLRAPPAAHHRVVHEAELHGHLDVDARRLGKKLDLPLDCLRARLLLLGRQRAVGRRVRDEHAFHVLVGPERQVALAARGNGDGPVRGDHERALVAPVRGRRRRDFADGPVDLGLEGALRRRALGSLFGALHAGPSRGPRACVAASAS